MVRYGGWPHHDLPGSSRRFSRGLAQALIARRVPDSLLEVRGIACVIVTGRAREKTLP